MFFRRSSRWSWLLLIVAAVAWWLRWQQRDGSHPLPGPVVHTEKSRAPRPVRGTPGTPPADAAPEATVRLTGDWQELQGCRLAEGTRNDGDSFDVLHNGNRYTLRLYFVDCPETYRHPRNGDRIAAQGAYFNGLDGDQTLQVGKQAREFTLGKLRSSAFQVTTRWEQVYDSSRYYAFVEVQGQSLDELLVRNGLARIYTKGEDHPAGPKAKTRLRELRLQESTARQRRAGAWSRHPVASPPKR